jgi:hypothetical protein
MDVAFFLVGAKVGAWLDLPEGMDVRFFLVGAEVGARIGLPEGMNVIFFLVGAEVGARLGLPVGMDGSFFLVGAEVGARIGLPEGMDVNFFLVGAKVGARLGFPAVTDDGFLEGRVGGVGFLVGLIDIVSADSFKGRSSVVDRAPQTALITASKWQMWIVIMTTFANSQRTRESNDINLDFWIIQLLCLEFLIYE